MATILPMALAGCAPPGKKLLRMEVSRDGEAILRTTFDAPDSQSAAELWRHAGAEPFASEELAPIPALDRNPLKARLSGKLEIRILHVDRVETSASLDGLELVRRSPGSAKWYLPEAEVDRIRRAAAR